MIRARSTRSIAFVLSAMLAAPPAANAQSAEERGLEIAKEARDRDRGFGNFTASQTMVLRNKQGRESRRQLRIKVLEVADDGNKSLFVFDEPRGVKGTALLIHSHREGPDDQWLYLPALKRVKRISSSNRSGSFMGSEFSYEDLGTPEVEKYKYRHLKDEACGELECSVVENVPVEKGSGYTRQVVWRDKDELRIWKIEYFDRKNAHLKTLTLGKYRRYLDRYWRASEMTMENHLTGKSTIMSWSDFAFRAKLSDRDFSQSSLKRIR